MAEPIVVLLVEDNPDDAALVQELLREVDAGSFQVEWAKDLHTCLERLIEGPIDVILSDLNLPDGQGLDTFRQLYASVPTVPIVVLTGTYEEKKLALAAVRQGAQDYLVKGQIDGKLLSRVLRYAIERKQVEAALHAANFELKMKLDQLAWLNQIALEREQRIMELKQENQRLREQLDANTPPERARP